jgi:hypothetical protein
MATRPILVLCEGPHDIAFLTRLLHVAVGAVSVDLPVGKLPEPFGAFFLKRLSDRNANQAKVGGYGPVSPDDPPLLESVYEMPDQSRAWYFLNCCGDSRANQINAFLKPLVEMAQASDPEKRLAQFAIVFVNDADEIGVLARQKLITGNHSEALSPLLSDFSKITANNALSKDGFGVGTCVFTAANSDMGTLEDIVWRLWSQSHLDRLHKSRELMNSLAVEGTKIGPGSTPSKRLKAILTAAGQTECPGYSLAVVLRETHALDENAMKADTACLSYINVLMEV